MSPPNIYDFRERMRERYRKNPPIAQSIICVCSILLSFVLTEFLTALFDFGKWENVLYYLFLLLVVYALVIATLIFIKR